ncbi:MAG: ArsR/SmtB family transcription factor [Gemmatimonadales bacterium]
MHKLAYMNVASTAAVNTYFAALGDRMRLRLACCLLTASQGLCVCELVDSLQESQPNVSRHLKVLKAAGLVTGRRDGRWIYYQLRDPEHPLLQSLRTCIETVCCCADVQQDLGRLSPRLRLRRGGKCVVGATRTGASSPTTQRR